MITISAPGKLMLLGEHAVVYNRPCLVTAVEQRMRATLEVLAEPQFVLDAPDVNVLSYQKPMSELGKGEIPKGAQFVEVAIKNFLEEYPIGKGIEVATQSEFSSQFGFGSSSASTVCVLKALFELIRKQSQNSEGILRSVNWRTQDDNFNRELFELAYKTVLDIQGKGSGFDVAAAIWGGTLYFVTGGKIIEPIRIRFRESSDQSGSNMPLIVGYTGVKADTATLIAQVAEKKAKNPEKVERIFEAITQLVEEAKEAIAKGDWERLGKLMDFNQEYLRDLGVSSEKLEALISAAQKAGALGAKLSGAGGGDCMIALAESSKREAVSNAIEKAGGEVIGVQANTEGVRVEA